MGTRAHTQTMCLWPLGVGGYVEGHSSLCAGPVFSTLSQQQSEAPRNAISDELQRGYTSASVWCFAAHRGVDCPSVGAAKAVSLSRARHPALLSALGTCRQGSGAISYQLPSSVLTQSLRNSHLIGLGLLLLSPVIGPSLQKLSLRIGGVPYV